MYRSLNADHIVETIEGIDDRLQREFGARGLARVSAELVEISRTTRDRVRAIATPNLPIRVAIFSILAVAIALVVSKLLHFRRTGMDSFADAITVLEAGVNILLVLGAGIFFLATLQSRMRRARILQALHELRSIVHVIDMHQLQKDPDQLITQHDGSEQDIAEEDARHRALSSYLDYCAELIALAGKLAGLYVQRFDDTVVIATVAEIDSLITGLSQKLWTKISIIHTTMLLANSRRREIDEQVSCQPGASGCD